MKKNIKHSALIFMGPPGSGKGTQASMLGKKLKIPTISLGELFREQLVKKTELGKKLGQFMNKGKLVPQEIVEKVLDKKLRENLAKKGFILDGYPRKTEQLENLISRLTKGNVMDSALAILVKVSNTEIKKRLGGRRACQCGAVYHINFKPSLKKGICDVCGSKLFIREDDRAEVIKKRLSIYEKESKSLLDFWKKQKKLVVVNGEQDIKNVFKELIEKLKRS